ncbi:MAG TPA: class I SAM-dependent methyltransferase [Gaiellaceae bacterium]|nr:class I SAM-dependent methyltransferase [Gaiellaceae bacterium]
MSETHDVVWTPEKIAATWDFFSESLAGSDLYFSSHAGRWIVKRADSELQLRGKRILDFGCGRGDLLAHLFARGIAARGLEFSEESARTTSARFAGQPLFQGIAAGPAELEDGSFDVIFLVEVIEHLLDDQIPEALTEVHRLLAPGGHVVVTCPNGENLAADSVRCPDCGAVFHRWQHVRSLDPASISALFESHGFRTEKVEGVYWGLTPYAVVRTWLRNPGRLPTPHLLYIGGTA